MKQASKVTAAENEIIEYDLPKPDPTLTRPAPTSITVKITLAERAVADRLGLEKDTMSENDQRAADWEGSDKDGGHRTENHKDGVAAEMAHGRYRGVNLDLFEARYYRVNTFKMADWGSNTEVRSTKSRWWAGKVKERDLNERYVVFYRKIDQLTFMALGWLTVGEAKAIGKWDDPYERGKPAFFIRDNQLHSLDTLPDDPDDEKTFLDGVKTVMQIALEKAGLQ